MFSELFLILTDSKHLQEEWHMVIEVTQHQQRWIHDDVPGICNDEEGVEQNTIQRYHTELHAKSEDTTDEQY